MNHHRSPSVFAAQNADDHGDEVTRPLGATQQSPGPDDYRRPLSVRMGAYRDRAYVPYRHRACVRCGSPIRWRWDDAGVQLCRDCDRRVRWFRVLLMAVIVAGVLALGLLQLATPGVTP